MQYLRSLTIFLSFVAFSTFAGTGGEMEPRTVFTMLGFLTYRIREKFRGRKVSRFSQFYSYSESFIMKYSYKVNYNRAFLANVNILT